MRLTKKWFWLVLLALLLTSLIIPATREAHVLCFRMLFHLRGKTYVQGQPPGCLIYTIPNVQFSDEYRQTLRQQSSRSANDFILATAVSAPSRLNPPTADSWKGHPLLKWAALTYVRRYTEPADRFDGTNRWTVRDSTNSWPADETAMILRYAQAENSSDGALWLAKALLDFRQQQPDSALAALRTAAVNPDWSAGTNVDFSYQATLFEKAGLSQLDAATQANAYNPEDAALAIQLAIRSQLQQLMAKAVRATNDQRFSELLGLLIDLRKADWVGPRMEVHNLFRSSLIDDDLLEAMAARVREGPLRGDSESRASGQLALYQFLSQLADQRIAARFFGQADMVQTEKNLRRAKDGLVLHRQILAILWNNLAGAYTSLALLLLTVVTLARLPFTWTRRTDSGTRRWPREAAFWIPAVLSLTVGVVLSANYLHTMGYFNEIGLQSFGSQPMLSSQAKELLLSIVLCGTCFAAAVLIWKGRLTTHKGGPITLWLAYVYVISIFAMAYFRFQAVQAIVPNL